MRKMVTPRVDDLQWAPHGFFPVLRRKANALNPVICARALLREHQPSKLPLYFLWDLQRSPWRNIASLSKPDSNQS